MLRADVFLHLFFFVEGLEQPAVDAIEVRLGISRFESLKAALVHIGSELRLSDV